MTAPTSLPQAAVLLAYDPTTGRARTVTSSARIVVAAAIGELVLAGRVTVVGDKIEPVDHAPTGVAVADTILAQLDSPALLRNVLTSADLEFTATVRPEQVVREELVARGDTTVTCGGVLRRTRLVATQTAPTAELTEQVGLAVRGGSEVNSRLAALIAVLDAAGYLHRVVGEQLTAADRATVERIVSDSEFALGLRRAWSEILGY